MASALGSPRPRRRGGAITPDPNPARPDDAALAGGGFHLITAPNPSPHTLAGTNTYLIGAAGRAVVIDPGPDDAAHVARVLDRAASSGWQVSLIVISHGHSDHVGAAERLAIKSGAPVRSWRSEHAPFQDEEVLAVDGGRLRVLHTPGHAPDHVVFYWEDQATLFSGDLILGEGTVQVTPPGGSMVDYLRSLERVGRLELRLIAPGHGPLIRDPHRRIAEYLARRRLRERQVLEALAAAPRTAAEVAAVIYPELDPRLRKAAEGTTLAHLEKLLAEGRVRRAGDHFTLA
jgi:glyoxylase-like metal-dependent hydrolase (beta-lactamase superfamily II)